MASWGNASTIGIHLPTSGPSMVHMFDIPRSYAAALECHQLARKQVAVPAAIQTKVLLYMADSVSASIQKIHATYRLFVQREAAGFADC